MNSIPSLFGMMEQADARPVIQPWDYVRMRREAARLTIEQAAKPYWHRPEHRADVERSVRRQEGLGYRPTDNFPAEDMSRAYPFSLDVYYQLCVLPAEQHPRLCLTCGWDQWTVQTDLNGTDVTWSEAAPHSCTRCEQIQQRKGGR